MLATGDRQGSSRLLGEDAGILSPSEAVSEASGTRREPGPHAVQGAGADPGGIAPAAGDAHGGWVGGGGVTVLDRVLVRGGGVLLLALGFLPIANWIPGGHEAPWYDERVREWLMDGALVLGVGVLLAILSRRLTWLWRPGWWAPVAEAAAARPGRTGVLLGVGAFLLYAVIAQVVFSAKPLHIDEIIQVWQARVMAGGRLWVPTPEHPEFTAAMHLVDHEGRRFGQFPMGGPAMLALGSLVRLEWLVGPLFGAVSAMLAWALFRRIQPRAGVALTAAVLFAVAPFTAFMAGSHMNHVTALTWILVAMVGLERAVAEGTRWTAGLVAGLGFGIAATIRPVDALAFALPAGFWLGWRALRAGRWAPFLASGIGVGVPLALLFAANWVTTGKPFLMAYALLWGADVGPGFHTPPWGATHTPLAGLELLNLYLLRLQLYLFEAPVPALLPAAVALLLSRSIAAFDRYLLVAAELVCGAYWMYWHDGFYLGPRFMYPLVPIVALWTARALPALRALSGSRSYWYRVASFAVAASVPLVLFNVVQIRAVQYRNSMQTMRFDADKTVRHAGVRNAVILVRESWGAEVVIRMWAVGIGRGQAEQFYRRIDTCTLDLALLDLERRGVRGPAAGDALVPLLADSSRVQPSTLSPDFTQQMLPGAVYPTRCLERLARDREGTTLMAPFLLARAEGNVFVRDLHERNARLRTLVGSRPVYLIRPRGPGTGEALVLQAVSADSIFSLRPGAR